MALSSEMEKALLVKRQVMLVGKVDIEKQEHLCTSIIYLNAVDLAPVTLFIDSNGGSMFAESMLGDIIADSLAPIHAVVTGVAYSAAFAILQACHVRKAYPHTRFLFHAPTFYTDLRIDNEEKVEKSLQQLRKHHAEQVSHIARRSGQSESEWREWSKSERRFEATEALDLGIIDEIIRPSLFVSTTTS